MAAATGEVGEVRHLSVNKRLLSYSIYLSVPKKVTFVSSPLDQHSSRFMITMAMFQRDSFKQLRSNRIFFSRTHMMSVRA